MLFGQTSFSDKLLPIPPFETLELEEESGLLAKMGA